MGFSFQGTKFEVGDDFITMVEVGCLTGYSETQGAPTKIDDTCANTTGNKKFLVGLGENMTVELDLSLDHSNAGYLQLVAARKNTTVKSFKITYADDAIPTVMQATGYVFAVSKTGTVDDKFTATVSLELLTDFEAV